MDLPLHSSATLPQSKCGALVRLRELGHCERHSPAYWQYAPDRSINIGPFHVHASSANLGYVTLCA